jgi:hypothetical protein
MITVKKSFLLCLSSLSLAACAPVTPLATGEAARTWMREQTLDPQASTRHGEQAPQGTDPDVANAAVKQLRTPARSRPAPMGGMTGGLSGLLKDLGE